MEQISKAMKKISFVLSIGSIALLALMLAACGSDSTTTPTKKGSWDKKADFGGITRGNAVGFVIDNKAYVVGGYNTESKRVNDMWQYDATANSWTRKADFPGTARSQAVAFVIGSKGYVGTGISDNSTRLKDFYEYNPATDQWTKIADFANDAGTSIGARYGCVAFSLNNRGFVGAGFNGNAQNDLWEYIPGTNTWVVRASFPTKRVNAASFVIDNAAYIIGGVNNNTTITNVEKYVPSVDGPGTWEQKAKLTQRDKNGNSIAQPLSREYAGTFTIDGFGYVTTGSASGATFGDTWQYNPATDVWVEYYSLSKEASTRDGAVTFAIGSFGYITTGRAGGFRLEDTWVFDPLGDEGTNGNGL